MEKIVNGYALYEVKFEYDDEFDPVEWCDENLASDDWMSVSYDTILVFGARLPHMPINLAFSIEEFRQTSEYVPIEITYHY